MNTHVCKWEETKLRREPGQEFEAQTQGEQRSGEITGPRMVKESSLEEGAPKGCTIKIDF